MSHLATARLTLVPFSEELVRAAMASQAALAEHLQVQVHSAWPQIDFAGMLPFLATVLAEAPDEGAWTRLVIHTADSTVIGEIGFKGLPDGDGTVEIGYSIVPAYQGRGYATEAATALIDWAFAQPGVRRVTAECLVDNPGSIRVLEKAGLQRVGADGDLLKWAVTR